MHGEKESQKKRCGLRRRNPELELIPAGRHRMAKR